MKILLVIIYGISSKHSYPVFVTNFNDQVAQGWMNEARLLLETRQTVQALSALATAISIAANLET